MTDLSKTIEPKSDQMNSDSLVAGPMTITITKVTADPGSAEQPILIHHNLDPTRPFKPCKTVRRLLVSLWGADGNSYVGRSLTLYNDPEVKWGGLAVGGIRVSHASHISKPVTLALTASRGNKKPVTIKPLVTETQADEAPDNEAVLEAARTAARLGKDAFSEHWKAINKPERAIVNTIIAECKKLTEEADADVDNLPDDYDAGNITDDPFEGEK